MYQHFDEAALKSVNKYGNAIHSDVSRFDIIYEIACVSSMTCAKEK